MKRLLMTAALVVGTVSPALAAGPYVGGSVGLSIFHDADLDRGGTDETITYDPGFAINASGGYNFGNLRVEGEYGLKRADTKNFAGFGNPGVSTRIHSAMANVFYDFTPTRVVSPVVGLGIGALFGDFEDIGTTHHDTQAGYQVSVGAAFKVANRVNLDVAYRLQGAFGDFHVGASDVSYLSSNILVGARYNF